MIGYAGWEISLVVRVARAVLSDWERCGGQIKDVSRGKEGAIPKRAYWGVRV